MDASIRSTLKLTYARTHTSCQSKNYTGKHKGYEQKGFVCYNTI